MEQIKHENGYSDVQFKIFKHENGYSDVQFKIFNKKVKKLAILQILYILFYKLIHWPIIKKIKKKRLKNRR